MSEPVIAEIRISGRARTKGSMKVITNARTRKPMMIEDHKHSKPWREHIVRTIRKEVWEHPNKRPEPYLLPVQIQATFLLPQTGDLADSLNWPTINAGVNANGDLDKFLRNLLDALVDASVLADDSQVVEISSIKMWAMPGMEEVQVVVLPADIDRANRARGCRDCGWMDWHAIGCENAS